MTTRFADHLLEGDHASRPAFGSVPAGTLYACSDHSLIYQSDGVAAWSTWATLGGGAPDAHAASHENGGSDEIDVTGLTGAGGSAALVGAHATNTAGTSFTGAGEHIMPFATEDYDTNAFHDLVTNNSRLTVPTGLGGMYHIIGKVSFATTVTDQQYVYLRKNAGADTYAITFPATGGKWSLAPIAITLVLAQTDYIELLVSHGGAGAELLDTGVGRNYLSMYRIGT